VLKTFLKATLKILIGLQAYEEVHAQIWARRLRAKSPDVVTDLIQAFVRPGDTCIDIGAHGGTVSFDLARAVGAHGIVFAFEPRPDYARKLGRALRLIGAPNVSVIPVALGESDGESLLVVADSDGDLTGRSHLASGLEDRGRSVTVALRSLDSFSASFPQLLSATFVKIDVEGAELQILRGGLSFFTTRKPVIYCEIEDEYCSRYGHSAENVRTLILSMGYSIAKLDGGDFLCVPAEKLEIAQPFFN
jgi:FkbM family methyltransferase